jgi:hypothetical protein
VKLTPAQIAKRGEILQSMFNIYLELHPYLNLKEATQAFAESIENDPIKLRIINSMAAAFSK